MKIKVGSNLRIINATPDIKKWCEQRLILQNPDYFKKERMGKWTGNTPKYIQLYERVGDEVRLPFGCLRDIWGICGGSGVEWIPTISPIKPFDYESHISLYPYQEKAVIEALRTKNGVLVMPCGSGKTQSGLEIISRIGGRALWLTHTQDLLNQSKHRAESVLGNVGTGIITAGKVNIGEGITFATIQTMSKIDLESHKDDWDIIIVDECQHCCGSPTRVTQFYKVVSKLSARYKIGLTATPKRADGLERSMFALLGDIIYEVPKSDVEDTTCPIVVERRNTWWTPDYGYVLAGDGTIDYHKIVESMIKDKDRFQLILDDLSELPKDSPVIVLANRVEYLTKLCEEYNKGIGKARCLSGMSQSKASKEVRKKALKDLNDGNLDCIFATYQLAKEGLDVPNLRYVVFATPEKDETTVIQSVGRVGRKAEGKEFGTVIDYVDDFGLYISWSRKRVSYYKKIGAEVV